MCCLFQLSSFSHCFEQQLVVTVFEGATVFPYPYSILLKAIIMETNQRKNTEKGGFI